MYFRLFHEAIAAHEKLQKNNNIAVRVEGNCDDDDDDDNK